MLLLVTTQSCLPLCNPIDCSPPGSSVLWILPARTLEWITMSSSRGSSLPRDQTQVSLTAGCILYCLSHHGSPPWSIRCQIFLTFDCDFRPPSYSWCSKCYLVNSNVSSRKLQREGHSEQGVSAQTHREVTNWLGGKRKTAQIPCVLSHSLQNDWLQLGFSTF